MDELTRVLWNYACRCRLEGCYDLQMKTAREEEEEMTARGRKHLEEAGCPAKELEKLCYGLEIVRTVDMEAAFTCGLRLGLALREKKAGRAFTRPALYRAFTDAGPCRPPG